MVDTTDLKSVARKGVWVRVPLWAFFSDLILINSARTVTYS